MMNRGPGTLNPYPLPERERLQEDGKIETDPHQFRAFCGQGLKEGREH
jgi:hypothetical protein